MAHARAHGVESNTIVLEISSILSVYIPSQESSLSQKNPTRQPYHNQKKCLPGFQLTHIPRFPNEKPPTLFHPASPTSPKAKPVSYSTSKSYTAASSSPKDYMDTSSTSTPANDTSSLYSTTSTISLLKHPLSNLKAKLSHKDHQKRGETSSKSTTPSTPKNWSEKTPRQSLAETYMIMAMR
ncbi:hypothetical protein EYC84_005423 [Monilinia fructicola]|uniref:Uncharacterized protein n=1 Tax=Monilinia fructicola TaxID=38448 RepID=A0A5M9JYY5_MONFR|nr:hypothetical protein EYC84_005423 [Monilinia fructicola]